MAVDPLEYPNGKTFGQLIVEIGDGASPEHFSAPCGFTSKSFNRGTQTSTADVPPCNNPDGPALRVTAVTGLNKGVSGSGVLAAADQNMWSAWHESGAPKNVRVHLAGVEYFVGPAVLTTFNITGTKGQNAELLQFNVQLDQAGAWTRTAGDPPA